MKDRKELNGVAVTETLKFQMGYASPDECCEACTSFIGDGVVEGENLPDRCGLHPAFWIEVNRAGRCEFITLPLATTG